MTDAYDAINAFFNQGGPVLPWIFALTFLMWTLIIERIWYFFSEHREVVRNAVERWEERAERTSWTAHQIRDAMVSDATMRINGSLPLINTCVTMAPLLGLLGTVTGMISVFEAMATQGGNARSMAAGVSMATIPTMAGMVVSLSGLFASAYLRRKIDYETELFQDHLTTEH